MDNFVYLWYQNFMPFVRLHSFRFSTLIAFLGTPRAHPASTTPRSDSTSSSAMSAGNPPRSASAARRRNPPASHGVWGRRQQPKQLLGDVCHSACWMCVCSNTHTNIHTYMHACIHTYIHTYMYIYIYIQIQIHVNMYARVLLYNHLSRVWQPKPCILWFATICSKAFISNHHQPTLMKRGLRCMWKKNTYIYIYICIVCTMAWFGQPMWLVMK